MNRQPCNIRRRPAARASRKDPACPTTVLRDPPGIRCHQTRSRIIRKRIIPSADEANPTSDDKWLDLEELVEVEVTSEDPEFPIESALLPRGTSGWRASGPGEQTIRLLFTQPQPLRRIVLEFVEPAVERTQEFVLRWSSDGKAAMHKAMALLRTVIDVPHQASTAIEHHVERLEIEG